MKTHSDPPEKEFDPETMTLATPNDVRRMYAKLWKQGANEMITRNNDREEKVVAAIADEVRKIEAGKALDAKTVKHTTSTSARELQAIQMASYFVEKFYKVAELFSVEIEKTAEEAEANAIATEIAEKVIAITGK